jgi:hypothetical protein
MRSKRKSIYRKVICQGASRLLAVTYFLPLEWELVRMKLVSQNTDSVVIRIEKVERGASQ